MKEEGEGWDLDPVRVSFQVSDLYNLEQYFTVNQITGSSVCFLELDEHLVSLMSVW